MEPKHFIEAMSDLAWHNAMNKKNGNYRNQPSMDFSRLINWAISSVNEVVV
jgi:hypothetical protein